MKYRITIESEEHVWVSENRPSEQRWNDVYQQVIEDLDVTELVSIINRPVGARRYPTAEEFWSYIEKTV